MRANQISKSKMIRKIKLNLVNKLPFIKNIQNKNLFSLIHEIKT